MPLRQFALFLIVIAIIALTFVSADETVTSTPPPTTTDTTTTTEEVAENGLPVDSPYNSHMSPYDEPIITVGPEHLKEFVVPEGFQAKRAIFMAENNCKLKNQFRGARAFLHLESGFYENMFTKLVAGLPRIKFYDNEQDFKQATIDPSVMTHDEMLTMLQNLSKDPHYYDPIGKVVEVFIARETTTEDIIELFQRFNIERGFEFNIEKRPTIDENAEDKPGNRGFDHDEELRAIDPTHTVALPPEGYDYHAEIERRDNPNKKDTKTDDKKQETKKDEL